MDNTVIEPGLPNKPNDLEPEILEVEDKDQTDQVIQTKHESEVQELKFVGFEPPKEKPATVFMKQHRLKIGAGIFLLVIGVAVGGIFLASGGSDNVAEVASESRGVDDGDGQDTSQQQVVEDTDYSDSKYSLVKDGEFLDLVSGEEVLLSRSEADWRTLANWSNWLFYSADKTEPGDESLSGLPTTIGMYALNYVTQEHVAIDDLFPRDETAIEKPMYVDGDFLHVILSGGDGGATYRCKLSEAKACEGLEIFLDGAGSITEVDAENVFVSDGFGDVDAGSLVISKLSTTDRTLTEVVNTSVLHGVGTTVAGIASDSLVWIVETDGDVTAETPEDIGASLQRLYAVDSEGSDKFVLPAQAFPIASPVLQPGQELGTDQILFVNDTKEVVFDTVTKQFGAVANKRAIDDKAPVDSSIDGIESRLSIIGGYSLKPAQD